MDYTTLKHLQERGSIAEKYNIGTELINNIKQLLSKYQKTFNNSLEEADELKIVSEANMNAAIEGLTKARNTLEIWCNK